MFMGATAGVALESLQGVVVVVVAPVVKIFWEVKKMDANALESFFEQRFKAIEERLAALDGKGKSAGIGASTSGSAVVKSSTAKPLVAPKAKS